MAMEFYYTRCSFEGHLFLVAVDQFNFRNVVSSRVVEKLHLPTANGQATIKFSIGKYEDEVLCDIAPMETCHILLGRSWLYNKSINPGRPSISFVHGGRKIKLICLSSDAVRADQLTLKIKIEKERREKETRESEEKMREKEEKEKELEKKSEKILFVNDLSSTICDVNLQEQEDGHVNEIHQLPCLKRKLVDIVLSASLCIQSADEKQSLEDNETQHMELFVVTYKNLVAHFHKHFGTESYLFEKENLHTYCSLCIGNLYYLQEGEGVLPRKVLHGLQPLKRDKSEFIQVVFDPGGSF